MTNTRAQEDSSPSTWVDRVRAAENNGDLLVAYDLAMRGLEEEPGNLALKYLATRALARSGATEQATALYARFGLGHKADRDRMALGARLAKDRALSASPAARRRLLSAAAAAYARVFARKRDYYTAINAATLYFLAGERKRAGRLARQALAACDRTRARSATHHYYEAATRAEAALMLGDPAAARKALADAARFVGRDFSAMATTRKQLRLICRATRASPGVLDAIRPPAVLHYQAPPHAIDRGTERSLARDLDAFLARHRIGWAYGSLAAGGDIVCAEACLRAGIELHVFLPLRTEEFLATAARGARWARRFRACLQRAASVTHATADSYQGDDSLFAYGDRLSMGAAILRAQYLDSAPMHLRLRAGTDRDPAGHAANLRSWRALGHAVHTLGAARAAARAARKSGAPRDMPPRFPRALLFGDVKGYSRVPDHRIPAVQKHIMGTISAAVRRSGRRVLYRNSWGDAIYVVLDDPVAGARCALDIQSALRRTDLGRLGLPADLSLRLAAHFGPVYDGYDPIRAERTFFGAHATLAARMEPVAVPGEVYVSEAMAAALAMAKDRGFRCEYVGRTPMAKGFGAIHMYALRAV